MSDIAENQLFALIGEKKIEAIRLYLQTHNARYSNKLELSGSVTTKDEPCQRNRSNLSVKLSSYQHYVTMKRKKTNKVDRIFDQVINDQSARKKLVRERIEFFFPVYFHPLHAI